MLERKQARGGVPPKGAQAAAKRGLELRRKFNRGGTMVGVARARDISNGKNLSESTVRRMKAYFDRHEVDKQGKDWDNQERPSNGKIAWLLWGGDAGRTWATMLVNRWNREDGKKELPVWLPNGDEIENLQQLAGVLNTDVKTAAFHVLDESNPPKHLLAQAYKATRRVKTPEGRRRFGQPIGTVIKDDVLPDLQMELPGMPEKPKPRKRPVIKVSYATDGLGDEVVTATGKPIPIVNLDKYFAGSSTRFPVMEKDTEQLPDTPVYSELPDYQSNWKDVDKLGIPQGQETVQELYNALTVDKYDWEGNSPDAKNLKANVQYRVAQRILDHLDTDPELQTWTRLYLDSKVNDSGRTIKQLTETTVLNIGYNKKWANDENSQKTRYEFLRNLNMIDLTTSFEEALEGEYGSFINIDENLDLPENNQDWASWTKKMFPKTKDREALARYRILYEMDLISNMKEYDNYSSHSTESLIFMLETNYQIRSWAGTSGDTKPESVAFQLDVKEAFELDEAATNHMSANIYENIKEMSTFRKTLIRAMYAETQEFLAGNNVKYIEVYRGMHFDSEDEIPDFLKESDNFKKAQNATDVSLKERKQEYIADWIDRNYLTYSMKEYSKNKFSELFPDITPENDGSDEWLEDSQEYKSWFSNNEDKMIDEYKGTMEKDAVFSWQYDNGYDEARSEILRDSFTSLDTYESEISMQPISSWSLSQEQAESFADNGTYKIVLRTIVPAELVFSTAFSGVGCLSENEIVVLGGLGKAEIAWK
jgi:hypothetical protein